LIKQAQAKQKQLIDEEIFVIVQLKASELTGSEKLNSLSHPFLSASLLKNTNTSILEHSFQYYE